MWSFFKSDSHQKAVKRVPGFRFSGGRGETTKEAIQIDAEDIQWTRDAFKKKVDAKYAQRFERNPKAIDRALGELAKEYYLRERFGEKGKDWSPGPATKTDTAIQIIEICPVQGERITLYFDLSAFFPKCVTHEDVIQRLPGAKFSGGQGESASDAIGIAPENLKHFQDKFQKAMGSTLPADATQATEMVNGMIGELIKMQYLEERFGKQAHDWFCGNRSYLGNNIQAQEIQLADGQALTLYFDFSPIHGSSTQNKINATQPTIYVDKNALPSELRLEGRSRAVAIDSQMFGILLVTAYSGGWRDGAHLFKVTNGQVSLRNFDKAVLDDKEAASLGQTLSDMMLVDSETLEGGDMQPVLELIELCKDGGFTISTSANN